MEERVRREVWTRAAGRCVICNEWLLTDHLDSPDAVRLVGEVAHNAARSVDGPRGSSTSVSRDDRDNPENLLLLCPNDHTAADKRLVDPVFTEEYLRAKKRSHEAFVKQVTRLRDSDRTAVVRVRGEIRGAPGTVSPSEAAAATMNNALRVPWYLPDPDGLGAEIDLTGLPAPESDIYWKVACAKIDEDVARLHAAARRELVEHLSVFAIASVPLLVYLGFALDDTVSADIYERHRATESWCWDHSAPAAAFGVTGHDKPAVTTEAVCIVNASGTINPSDLPDPLAAVPAWTISPTDGAVPGKDTFRNSATLESFACAVRTMFSTFEQPGLDAVETLHLFAAAPVSAAVALGRQLTTAQQHPSVIIYHRTSGGDFEAAITIPSRTGRPN